MISSIPILLSLAGAAAGVTVGSLSSSNFPFPPPPKIVDQAYIIELIHDGSASGQSRAFSDVTAHAAFRKKTTDLEYTVRQQFTNPTLFYGLSITMQQNDTAEKAHEKLKSIDGVQNVWPVMEYYLNAPGAAIRQETQSTQRTCIPRPTSTSITYSATSSPTDTLTPPKATGNPDVASTLKMTEVDKLHALGIKGKGMKIGIIDTGVDHRHPSLGGGFGPGKKIAGGYAFVDDDGESLPVPIPDPLATCLEGGHGTHVAGIIGMQDPENIGFGLVGVAPEAEIYMYRVFGCAGGASTDAILAAMQQAYVDDVNVINLSLGIQTSVQAQDPFGTMTAALVANGIAVVAAAGNDGGVNGPFFPSSPSIGADVISVGSVENTVFPIVYRATDSQGWAFNYASIWPLSSPPEGFDVYVLEGTGTGCEESAWIQASQTVANPGTTVIIFQTNSDCSVTAKIPFWVKYGFEHIASYPAPSTADNPYAAQYILLDQRDISTLYTNLLRDDGQHLVSNYDAAGGYPNYQMLFSNNTATSTPMKTGGMISYFSSYSPTWDTLELKPQLSGPGASILATWPLGFNSGYAAIRGTSMASPFVAACYALVKSQLPHLSVFEIRELLQSTSTPFEIGDADDFIGANLNFTIINTATESQTYTFSHNGAALMAYNPNIVDPSYPYPGPIQDIYATVKFASNQISVDAGQKTTISFTFTNPSDIAQDMVPVVSGFISVQSSSGEEFNLPYEGLPYSRRDARYLIRQVLQLDAVTSALFPTITVFDPVLGTVDFTNGSDIIEIDRKVAAENGLFVGPWFDTYQPTQICRADVLPANTTFIPTFYGFDTSVVWNYVLTTDPYSSILADGATPAFGVIGYATPIGQCSLYPPWSALPTVSVGDYRMLGSALKWGGNPDEIADWETWLSPVVRVIDSRLPNNGLP